ncbi:hypothetical protein FCH28_01085 [Streptomyces piniterrae]|uniref:Rad50/SbcC-type AAA domain-containing protein n=1 Tax=Streptomyces piniterrae TaxID=2571125 RepID=A0A4U0NX34_9ACTN|nr:hypothetical protein FCH28_01085 [Streptomyces piniterrae]
MRHAKLTELDAQPFTLITGQNGSGKTAMFQALHRRGCKGRGHRR